MQYLQKKVAPHVVVVCWLVAGAGVQAEDRAAAGGGVGDGRLVVGG